MVVFLRTRPSLPRSERLLRPPASIPRIPVLQDNQERFVARPTKNIPSVLKLANNLKPVTKKKVILAPKVAQFKTVPKESKTGASIQKPISAFKSVSTNERQGKKVTKDSEEDTPVYIPRYLTTKIKLTSVFM